LKGAAFATGLAVAGAFPSAQRNEPALQDLLAGAAAYVQRFSQGFATLLGDETYEQRVVSAPASRERERQRLLLSEVLFVWLTEEQSWLSARVVKIADGKPVPDSDTRLERLMADTSAGWGARVRRLRDEGARFNIGRMERNFSDPTMVLQFLDADIQRRFQFTLEGRDRVQETAAWRVSFKEQSRPTLIQSRGRDVPATGEVWLAENDQAVVQTRVALTDNQFNLRVGAVIRASFRHEPRFGIWVPAEMRERYEQRGRGVYQAQFVSFDDVIECVATYSNFRRFETVARIVN